MTTKLRWFTEDKESWGDGPWTNEPDKIVWVDEATDLDCMIHRNGVGALCGYVGVPSTHWAYGKDYDDVDVDVHGGLTYSKVRPPWTSTEDHGICHVPQPGREHDIWWLGFDCAHMMDIAPAFAAREREMGLEPVENLGWATPTYKPVEYVTAEVERLAKQLAGEEPPPRDDDE